jgi:hypothetical protein
MFAIYGTLYTTAMTLKPFPPKFLTAGLYIHIPFVLRSALLPSIPAYLPCSDFQALFSEVEITAIIWTLMPSASARNSVDLRPQQFGEI